VSTNRVRASLGNSEPLRFTLGKSVLESTQGINDIAASVSEQSVASTEIARNVEKIAQMSEENYASVQTNTRDVMQLDKLARELQDAVSKFKV